MQILSGVNYFKCPLVYFWLILWKLYEFLNDVIFYPSFQRKCDFLFIATLVTKHILLSIL